MLSNETVRLRALEPEDIDLLYKWENDTGVWPVGQTLEPFSRYVLKEYIAQATSDIYEKRELRLMIEAVDSGLAVGTVDLFDFEPLHSRAGVGILVEKSQRRRQYALQSLLLLKKYAFNVLQLHQLYCNIRGDNQASVALFKKAGFEVCGTRREWLKTPEGWKDELMLQTFGRP